MGCIPTLIQSDQRCIHFIGVKSAPEEKDKQKIYFPESQVGPARKFTGQISINKSDAFLI
jgi:hypothetical protein